MTKYPLLFVIFFIVSNVFAIDAVVADGAVSFSKSKRILAKEIYKDHQVSFYCSCTYSLKKKSPDSKKKKLAPDWKSCGYEPRKQPKRASRIEWEHVMPAHHFGKHLQCWKDGGRKACRKDPVFKQMESDMHNLVPAVGEVNGDRSNYKYGMIPDEKRAYGQCDVEIDFKAKIAEPAPNLRGDIARIYLYMSDRYGTRLSSQQRKLMLAWSKQDPVDAWERRKNLKVVRTQGNANKYIQ